MPPQLEPPVHAEAMHAQPGVPPQPEGTSAQNGRAGLHGGAQQGTTQTWLMPQVLSSQSAASAVASAVPSTVASVVVSVVAPVSAPVSAAVSTRVSRALSGHAMPVQTAPALPSNAEQVHQLQPS